jgi:sarcosine oxidase/L-pipecolate oxidase
MSKLNPCQHGFTKSKSTITNLVTYLDFITPLVSSQGKADAIYFDLRSAFDLVPHTLLLQKLSAFGLSGDYANWFCSYLTNRQYQVRVSGILSSPFVVLSGVPQGSVLGPLLFNIFMNDLCDVINYSRYIFLADDTKIFHVIKSPNDCN